jgi:hypothetical protein
MLPDGEREFFRLSLVSIRLWTDSRAPYPESLIWLLFQAALACYPEALATLTWGALVGSAPWRIGAWGECCRHGGGGGRPSRRYGIMTKGLGLGPLLRAGLPCQPQRLPGTDVLRNEFDCRGCGMSRLGCTRYRQGCRHALLRPRAAQGTSALRAKLTSAMRMPSSVAPRKIAVQTGRVPTFSRPPRMEYKATHKMTQMR